MGFPPILESGERRDEREGATWVDLYIKEMPTPKKGLDTLTGTHFALGICEEELGLGA